MLGGAGVAGHARRSHLAQDQDAVPAAFTAQPCGCLAYKDRPLAPLHGGYRQPLAVAAVIIMLAAGAAGALRYWFPHSR